MEKTKYIVHSDVNENNIYKEFDNSADAIKYAKDNIIDETWVDMVTFPEGQEDNYDAAEVFTIWNYSDENYLDQDFPESDIANIKDVDDADYAEFDKMYKEDISLEEAVDKLEENEDEVECKGCYELTPKKECIKTEAGYFCPRCAKELKEAKEDEDPFALDFDDVEDEEESEEKPEEVKEESKSYEELIDFLIADEDEAIKGYDEVLAQLDDKHVIEELNKVRTEEVAHKEFLEKIKEDKTAIYVEPLEPEEKKEDEGTEEESKEEIEESCNKNLLKENIEKEKEELKTEIKAYLKDNSGIDKIELAKKITKYLNSVEYYDSSLNTNFSYDKYLDDNEEYDEENSLIKLHTDNICIVCDSADVKLFKTIDELATACYDIDGEKFAGYEYFDFICTLAGIPFEVCFDENKKAKKYKKLLKENIEKEIKDYLAYCEKEKIEAKDYKSLKKYLGEPVKENLTEGDELDNAHADDLFIAADKHEEEEKAMQELQAEEETPKDECYEKEFAEDLNDKEYFDAMYKAYRELKERKTAFAAVYGYSKDRKFVPMISVKNNSEELRKVVDALRTKPKGQTDVTVYTIYKDRLDNIEDVLKEQGYIKEVKEEVNPKVEVKIGDVIHINHLQGEDTSKDGKEGIIKAIDDMGQLHGTWGSVAIIPGVDDFDIIKPEITEDIQDDKVVLKPTGEDDNTSYILNTIASWN